jgi:hypothetical protein
MKERVVENKGFEANGDAMLTERFNPNNVELNKRRFEQTY